MTSEKENFIKKIRYAKFEGVDYWNRPVFKLIDGVVRIGSLEKLVSTKEEIEEVIEYFKANPDELVIFGTTFDEEDPLGTSIKKGVIKIIN